VRDVIRTERLEQDKFFTREELANLRKSDPGRVGEIEGSASEADSADVG